MAQAKACGYKKSVFELNLVCNRIFIIPQEAVSLRPMPPPPGLAGEEAVDFNGFARRR
jgi:hypothetical protein